MTQKGKVLASGSSKAATYELPTIKNGENIFVDARLLHQKLKQKTQFADWLKKLIADYGFIENEDFIVSQAIKNGRGGHNAKEFHLTLDMAKETAMVSKTEAGRAIRRYFIAKEKELREKRLYGQRVNLTEIRRQVHTKRLNGHTMYPYRKVQELLGFSTKSSTSNPRRLYGALFCVIDNQAHVAEPYVQLMVARSTARAKAAEALAAQPVLPLNWGDANTLPSKL
jgi:phage anti-repressor protein